MLINRPFWQNLIEQAWLERNIIWLMFSVGKRYSFQKFAELLLAHSKVSPGLLSAFVVM